MTVARRPCGLETTHFYCDSVRGQYGEGVDEWVSDQLAEDGHVY